MSGPYYLGKLDLGESAGSGSSENSSIIFHNEYPPSRIRQNLGQGAVRATAPDDIAQRVISCFFSHSGVLGHCATNMPDPPNEISKEAA